MQDKFPGLFNQYLSLVQCHRIRLCQHYEQSYGNVANHMLVQLSGACA